MQGFIYHSIGKNTPNSNIKSIFTQGHSYNSIPSITAGYSKWANLKNIEFFIICFYINFYISF